jgi:hypothetical protein
MIAGEDDIESVVRADLVEEGVSRWEQRTERGVLLHQFGEVHEGISDLLSLDPASIDHSAQTRVRVSPVAILLLRTCRRTRDGRGGWQRKMDERDIDRTLSSCDAAVAKPGTVDLGALGFWKAVAAVKRRPDLAARHAERIGRIDREAFLRSAGPLVFPAALGVVLLVVGTAVGLVTVAAAPSLPRRVDGSGFPWTEVAYLVGAGILIGTTHGLAHFVVGRAAGIRFTHWYSRPPRSPQPGFKTDYASYLRTPARSRAWMHASGAIVTKVVPFAVAAVAWAAGAQSWAVIVLLALGVLQLVTDVTLSVRASDWKKFRREMRFAS